MSRLAVFAEQFPGSPIGEALAEHREDRAALLTSFCTSLQDDPRVYAVWLGGSFGREEADDLSDLDPFIVVDDRAVPEMGAVLRVGAERIGNFLTGAEVSQNAPPRGGFFTSLHEGRQGLLHLDCSWQALSAVEEAPERALLFSRLPEQTTVLLLNSPPLPPLPSQPSVVPVDLSKEEHTEDGIHFTWMMLSIAAKTLARYPDSDMGLMLYAKPPFEDAAALLGLEAVAATADWSVSEHRQDKVEWLCRLVG
ncbi:MAG: hypothetical protein V4671_02080, partial [Armatimonadota bacterium]